MVSSTRDRPKGLSFLPWHCLPQGRSQWFRWCWRLAFLLTFLKACFEREALQGNWFSCLPPPALPLSRVTPGCALCPSQTCCAKPRRGCSCSHPGPPQAQLLSGHPPGRPFPRARLLAEHTSFRKAHGIAHPVHTRNPSSRGLSIPLLFSECGSQRIESAGKDL